MSEVALWRTPNVAPNQQTPNDKGIAARLHVKAKRRLHVYRLKYPLKPLNVVWLLSSA